VNTYEFVIRLILMAVGTLTVLAGVALKWRDGNNEVTPILLIGVGAFLVVVGGSADSAVAS
jgi:uncharacterized membrane protein